MIDKCGIEAVLCLGSFIRVISLITLHSFFDDPPASVLPSGKLEIFFPDGGLRRRPQKLKKGLDGGGLKNRRKKIRAWDSDRGSVNHATQAQH